MNSKLELCQSCLSIERKLYPLLNLQTLLRKINITEIQTMDGGICWECKRIMEKFSIFKCRIYQAQEMLLHSNELTNLKCLSTLTTETNLTFINRHHYHKSFDPLTNCQITEYAEPKSIKQEEIDSTCDDRQDSEIDCKIFSTINTNEVNAETANSDLRKRLRKPRRRKIVYDDDNATSSDDEDDEKLMVKFTTIEFSMIEMMKNREEKRNHPNFKKLPYKCDTCVLGFTRKENLNNHMEKKHDEKIGANLCDVCATRFYSETALNRHRRKHFTHYRCKLCKYDASEFRAAVTHCRVKHSGDTSDRIHCVQCAAVVGTPEEMDEHIRTHHTLSCNECGEKFKGKNTLRTHEKRIHGVKREFICDLCRKPFMTKSRLESHMVTHNTTLAKKLAFCSLCNVQYKNIYVYRNHLRTSANHAVEAVQCTDCEKKFASKVYAKKHYNFYHLGKSQFKCETCNKLFISDWRLKAHKALHHENNRTRNFSCNTCGKSFYTSATLKSHQLTHSDQRSYMCDGCGDTFKQPAALYTHTKLVHGGVKRKLRS